VDWLNLPLWAPFGPKALFDENIDGLLKPKFRLGIFGISVGLSVLFAI
jgi:hypothetical protein